MAPKGVVITQLDKDGVEYIGLVKIDLLGNRALATVDEAVAWLRTEKKPQMNTDEHRSDRERKEGSDRAGQSLALRSHLCSSVFICGSSSALSLLQHGDTLGVNQLESPAMRHLLIQLRPTDLETVIQALALIRPGAASIGAKECFVRRRRGVEPVHYPHPALEAVLGETHGLMLYEDDALHVIQALTGLAAPEADRFRKRVTKHRTDEEARQLAEEFLAACARRGVSAAVAGELWVQLAKFNQYSFCKSHAVSYGLIAWKAVFLKAHHPRAFWTAALNNNQGMYPRRVYIEAIKRAGIALRLPCVNHSAGPFGIEDDALRTGLDAIASLDEEFRTALLADRVRSGPYRDLADFRHRMQPGPETLAALIRCGALDFTGKSRPALFLEADLEDRVQRSGETISLFGPSLLLPEEEWMPTDYALGRRLRDEWELLGFVIGPPLLSLLRSRLPADLVSSRELADHVGRVVRVAGVVATARHTETNDGRTMQFVTLEDEEGLIEVTLFPGTCPPVAHLMLGPYLATGRVEEQYGVIGVTARSFRLLV
jgi:DNA polymerase III alpha subunit